MLGSWPAFSSMLRKKVWSEQKPSRPTKNLSHRLGLDYVSSNRKVHGTDGAAVAHDSDGLRREARVLDRIAAEIHYASSIWRKGVLLSDRRSRIGKNSAA